MIGRIKIAFLFVFLAAAYGHEEKSLTIYDLPANEVEVYNGKYVKINKIFDQIHPHLHDFLMKLNLDPLELVDFSEPVIKLPGKLGSKIDFTNGYMHGLPCVRRTQDVQIKYEDKVVTLNMDLGWNKLDFNYRYRYDHLLIKRSGHVFGKVNVVDVNVLIQADFNTYKLSVNRMKFMRIGELKLSLGDNTGDHFLNGIIQTVTKVFHEIVLKHIEERSIEVFQGVLNRFNKLIPKPERMRLLENFDEMEFRNALFRVVENHY